MQSYAGVRELRNIESVADCRGARGPGVCLCERIERAENVAE